MMDEPTVILIVARPGDLQAGLQLLLANLHDVETLVAADEKSALGAVERHSPALMILDGDIPAANPTTLIRQVKTTRPATRCLVISNGCSERQLAMDSGADAAFIKGYPASEILAEAAELLAR